MAVSDFAGSRKGGPFGLLEPVDLFDPAGGGEKGLLFSHDEAILFGSQGQHVVGVGAGAVDAAALAHGESVEPHVSAHLGAVFQGNGPRGHGKAVLGEEKALVVVGNKADVLALSFGKGRKILGQGLLFDLLFDQATQGKDRFFKFFLGHHGEKVGLVFPRIAPFAKVELVVLQFGLDIVTRGKGVGSQLFCHLKKQPELDIWVAELAGVGGFAAHVRRHKGFYHLLFEDLLDIDDVNGNAELLCHVVHGGDGAFSFIAVEGEERGGRLRRCLVLSRGFVSCDKMDADEVKTLIFEKPGAV